MFAAASPLPRGTTFRRLSKLFRIETGRVIDNASYKNRRVVARRRLDLEANKVYCWRS